MTSDHKVGSMDAIGLTIGIIILLAGGGFIWYLGGWQPFLHKFRGQPEIQICNRQSEDEFYNQTCLNIFSATDFEIQRAVNAAKSPTLVVQTIVQRRLQDSISLESFSNQVADNCSLIETSDNQFAELENSYWVQLRSNKYSFDKQCNNDYLNQTIDWLLDESKSETISNFQIKEALK